MQLVELGDVQLGQGRRHVVHQPGLLDPHGLGPGEVVGVRRLQARAVPGPFEGPEPLRVVAPPGLQDLPGLVGAAEIGVPGEAEELQRPAEAEGDLPVVGGFGQPFPREGVPQELLEPGLGDVAGPAVTDQPVEGGLGIAGPLGRGALHSSRAARTSGWRSSISPSLGTD